MVLAAHVWHFWIGVVLVFASILTVLVLAAGYLYKVQRPQYPKNPDR